MPTNAEIHAAIDKYITAQRSHILNNTVAQIFHDMVDNIGVGGGGVPTLSDVINEDNSAGGNRITDLFEPRENEPNDAATAGYVDELIEISETKAGIAGGTRKRLVMVRVDESNNDDGSIYLHDGSTLILLLTIPV